MLNYICFLSLPAYRELSVHKTEMRAEYKCVNPVENINWLLVDHHFIHNQKIIEACEVKIMLELLEIRL